MKQVYTVYSEQITGNTERRGHYGRRYTSIRSASEAAKELIRSGEWTRAAVMVDHGSEGVRYFVPVNGREYTPANYDACDYRVRRI